MIEAVTAINGIDVSHYQGYVDWKMVAQSQIQFAFLKATEGATYIDPELQGNWTAARSEGIVCGAYHFFRPLIAPDAQAANFLKATGSELGLMLPPVLDLEVPNDWKTIPKEERLPLILDWLNIVEAAWNMTPILYFSPSFIGPRGVLPDASPLLRYPLWIAHYTNAKQPTVPPPWQAWTFWQHSQTGEITGITGNVDLDTFNGQSEDFYRLTHSRDQAP